MYSTFTWTLFIYLLYLRHPIHYHNVNAGVNPWRKVLVSYVFPVVAVSFAINLPKFLELEVK